MIQKSGDYYVYEDNLPSDNTNSKKYSAPSQSTESHQAIGNVK